MPKKGHKSRAGIGDSYGEVKKDINLTLTPTAIEALAKKAKELGLSRSELVEKFARGESSINHNEETNQFFFMSWWKIG
jgi:hypothetical protein